MANDRRPGPPGDADASQSTGNSKPNLTKCDVPMSAGDHRILEQAIRQAVPRLVGAGHPELQKSTGTDQAAHEPDLHLHPELDPLARQLPGTEKAIAYRTSLYRVLVDMDPRGHRELIDELVRSGIPLHTLAIQLFSPVAVHLGNLWCTDESDFMQVAVASTRLGMIINHLSHGHGHTVGRRDIDRRILLARTRGALHTIGVSIVASCFRDMGWIVEGGADLELDDSLYMKLSASPYNLVGISVGQVDEVDQCAHAIRRIHSSRTTKQVKVAIGGPAVMRDPLSFHNIGADVVARSALEVMQLAESVGR